MTTSNVSLTQIEAVLSANSFKRFVTTFWPLVSADPFVPGRHIDAICDHLQAIAEGKLRRLAVNVAIRHSKSLLCSVLFPVWLWVRDPSKRIITATYSKDLTVRDSIRSRSLIEHPEFQRHFPHIVLKDDANRRDFYSNDAGGHRLAVSIGSRTAGFDADVVIADDIHDMATRTSQAERESAIDYFMTTLTGRLADPAKGAVVIAGHRVHEDDVYARLRATYGDDGTWTWLMLPEEFTDKFRTWFNGIGWTDTRADGELLWPARFDADVVSQQRRAYRHEYSAIFLQEPTPADGNLFKPSWFKTWTLDADGHYVLDGKAYPKAKGWRFVTVDTAVSTESGADYTVAQCWDVVGPGLVLVDQLRKRLDGVHIVPALVAFYRLHQPQFICVEAEFVGKFVLDQLKAADLCVKPFRARGHGDKLTRAVAAEIRLEAGRVYFPAGQSWVADLKAELLAFPNAAHDDQVDCLSMACILADKYVGPAEPVLSPEEQERRQREQQDQWFRKMMFSGTPF